MAPVEVDAGAETFASRDRQIIERYNRLLKESQDRERRLLRHNEWRGNKLPPFSIEPMPHERHRLVVQMTPEQRAARIQWLKDQELAPNEPRTIPELNPRNPIRRMFAAPWNIFFKTLKPLIGEELATHGRVFVPRLALAAAILYGSLYHIQYNPHQWSGIQGCFIWKSKEQVFPGDKLWPEGAQMEEFQDRGFKSRTSHQDLVTSSI